MGVDIEQINPRNEAALKAWWEVGRAATAERPGRPWPVWEQSRVALPADNPERDLVFLAAIDGREMVGAALVIVYLNDNTHAAGLDVYVHPERRREGVGSALLAEVEAVAAGLGRTTLLCEAFTPPGDSGLSEHFALARGFDPAHREAIRELAMSDYDANREGCLAHVAGRAASYPILTFDTVCPAEHAESFGRLLGTLMAEVPMGDLDRADSEWTPERLRAAEQRNVDIGRHVLTALAVAPDGEVAGVSDVRVNHTDPQHGQVGITLVSPDHRGHRLGMALKLASHDLAAATYPGIVSMDTSNADTNTHMNAVNDALGYRTIETLLELQKKL